MAYTRHFFDPVEQLGHWFAEMQMAQASAERILSLIEADPGDQGFGIGVREALNQQAAREPAPRRALRRTAATRRSSEIELKNVSFAYDPAKPVLADVNLHAWTAAKPSPSSVPPVAARARW